MSYESVFFDFIYYRLNILHYELLNTYIYIYIYNHKANADRRKILSIRVLPNCIKPLLVGINLQFAASKTPAHSTEPNGPMKLAMNLRSQHWRSHHSQGSFLFILFRLKAFVSIYIFIYIYSKTHSIKCLDNSI